MSFDDDDNLQDMLGFCDSNSSRGDRSAIFNSSDIDNASNDPSAEPVTTPRRSSHRPPPRQHSPQIPLPTPSKDLGQINNENSPDFSLAFTPGNTKLDDRSLRALQVICTFYLFISIVLRLLSIFSENLVEESPGVAQRTQRYLCDHHLPED